MAVIHLFDPKAKWLLVGISTIFFLFILSKTFFANMLTPSQSTIQNVYGGKTAAEWKQILSPEAFRILREDGTEIPFTSPLNSNYEKGTYVSADCGEALFRSEDKFDSGTGWPSFTKPISPEAVTLIEDTALGISRVEVRTKICDSHLGHVFDDGPPPTSKRYCINGAALTFIPDLQ